MIIPSLVKVSGLRSETCAHSFYMKSASLCTLNVQIPEALNEVWQTLRDPDFMNM